MDLSRLIGRTLAIQAIPSPTFHESRRAAYLEAEFRFAGLERVEIDPAGNLYGVVPGGAGLPVIITAHLDTVFGEEANVAARLEGDRLVGPGVGDNAIALAALIELAEDLPSPELPGDVWLVANVCEEGLGNLQGMRRVVSRFGRDIAAYICLEGMALGHIYHRALPVRRYRITAKTSGGHAWIHAGRASAIHTLLRLGSDLLTVPRKGNGRSSFNVGLISGGTTINTIAHSAWMELDLRSESQEALEALSEQVNAHVKRHSGHDVAIEVATIGERPGGGISHGHPLVLAAQRALNDAGETQVLLEMGSTDASIPLSHGLPGICVGITRGGEAHSLQEFVEIRPVERGYKSVLDLTHAALKLGERHTV
ncbi:MAG: hypothetical protein A2Z37_09940 [Chloroflexi bacterium RBG_19FT_COMBO_62_14]|nr:MAG: hypothetical protein A2Z37_09940 [Chloroflexi bacterium RBG_19FT_COMBO_62_14]